MTSLIKQIGVVAATLTLVPLAVTDQPAGSVAPAHLHAQRDAALPGVPMAYTAAPVRTTGKPFVGRTPVWPAGSATVPIGTVAHRAGSLPISVRAAGTAGSVGSAGTAGTDNVTVDVLDRAATAKANVDGL